MYAADKETLFMKYNSTRNKEFFLQSSEAIIKGLAPDGGLFVPEMIPLIDEREIEAYRDMGYRDRAKVILSKFLTDYTDEEISLCVDRAYTKSKFKTDTIAPVYKLTGSEYILELWHGPTCAFKDMALQILPHFLVCAMKKNNIDKEVVILVATSGDTGKAALEGFADVNGTRINVFYPNHGVSRIQELQMVTQQGNNVNVTAVNGNFDDAQNGVKAIFTNKDFEKTASDNNFMLSSANSINWGRLVPQIVYYFSAYAEMMKAGEINCGDEINVVVPTGNFGNILAAYYAKRMGLKIKKLICASNSNNVLTDFINTGIYNREREFNLTISPSMDILISSNLERFLYHISDENAELVSKYMEELKSNGKYEVSGEIKKKINDVFWAGFATDSETKETIREVYEKYSYVMDTHTAVAQSVYEKYVKETGDETKTLVASTASPFKFSRSVLKAINGDDNYADGVDEFEVLDELSRISNEPVPESLAGLKTKEPIYDVVCSKEELLSVVKEFLRL